MSYVHDAHGRRIGRVVDGVLERGWLYKDGINPIAQLDAAGNVEWTFVYATRAHVPDYMVHATDGRVLRFIVDHLGSVRLLVDVATGAIVERMDYDEYGRVEGASGAWSVQPFGYAGGLYDPDTGLVRFGARDYDPETGRWTAKDPIGFGGGDTNLYAYAGGDPINFIDPTGLDVWEFIFGGKLGWLFPDKGPPGQSGPFLMTLSTRSLVARSPSPRWRCSGLRSVVEVEALPQGGVLPHAPRKSTVFSTLVQHGPELPR